MPCLADPQKETPGLKTRENSLAAETVMEWKSYIANCIFLLNSIPDQAALH
jgi:hypothetical protein